MMYLLFAYKECNSHKLLSYCQDNMSPISHLVLCDELGDEVYMCTPFSYRVG